MALSHFACLREKNEKKNSDNISNVCHFASRLASRRGCISTDAARLVYKYFIRRASVYRKSCAGGPEARSLSARIMYNTLSHNTCVCAALSRIKIIAHMRQLARARNHGDTNTRTHFELATRARIGALYYTFFGFVQNGLPHSLRLVLRTHTHARTF